MLAGRRATRVGDKILREMASFLLSKVKDPRVQGVTMTGIRLSDDLKRAKIYYSVIGDEGRVKEVQAGLDSAKGFIKREIGLRMELRYVPELTFVHDPSLETGSHLEILFQEMEKKDAGGE